MNMLNEIRQRLPIIRQEDAKYFVRCDEIGLNQIVQRGESTQARHLAWNEATQVFAYKRDCFAFDQICIVIGTATHTDAIEVREDDEGFQYLIEQMPSRIVGCLPSNEWWDRVALPPFAARWTQIYPDSGKMKV